VIEIADGAVVDEPVYVVHQWHDAAQRMSHPRVIVHAGRNSRCTLIEQFLGPAETEYFTNAVTTIDLAPGASVRHYRVQQESTKSFHIAHIAVRQQADSRYSCHDIALGGGLARTDIATMLDGGGAHAALHGLFAPTGSQHLDTHTRIEHVAPHTTSEEDYRGIAAGRGRGVFNGKVIVRQDAQKIDARQSSRNLLLAATAEIDTKPELEIYANDVKCSHGATTGRLDEAALFYLRSRGLSQSQARALLIRAFAEAVLSSVEHAPVRAHLERQLDERFAVLHEDPS
jgi:Fe-S cluster assembly protein SufD